MLCLIRLCPVGFELSRVTCSLTCLNLILPFVTLHCTHVFPFFEILLLHFFALANRPVKEFAKKFTTSLLAGGWIYRG